jgi:hypothetical protein
MSPSTTREIERLATTLATWVFQLSQRGVALGDPEAAGHVARVAEATDPDAGNAAARGFVSWIAGQLAGSDPEHVAAFARRVFGDRASTAFGEGSDREERAHRVRKYQFARGLPWLARIWERVGADVRPGWLLVDRVTDAVTAADPDPWNEIEEERTIPLSDFVVLWELADNASLHVA